MPQMRPISPPKMPLPGQKSDKHPQTTNSATPHANLTKTRSTPMHIPPHVPTNLDPPPLSLLDRVTCPHRGNLHGKNDPASQVDHQHTIHFKTNVKRGITPKKQTKPTTNQPQDTNRFANPIPMHNLAFCPYRDNLARSQYICKTTNKDGES